MSTRRSASAARSGRRDDDGRGEGLRTVIIALAANLGIAAAKLVAALLTRSSAMLAEVFHSTADTGNQVLLLVANRRAGRPPDPGYPLGHGREAYFWALIASLGMFFTGALLSVREGISELLHAAPIASPVVAYAVLGVSFCLDGLSLVRAYRQLRAEATTLDREFLEHLDITSDPVARAVFAEDAVSVAGNLVAAGGIVLHQVTGSAIPDAVAALVIGVCLGIVALDLARRNRDFLVGREAAPSVRTRLNEVIARQDGVARVGELLVTYVGPRRLWVVARLDVDHRLDALSLDNLLSRVQSSVHTEIPAVVRVDLTPHAI
ncbi:MAG: cation diffusion facilitator family transporter [Pseudomonadota bacterium]